jgi:hypothetical protein
MTVSDNFTVYKEHSSTLRTWLVAYGIGLPALILANEDLWIRLKLAGVTRDIGLFFIAGVSVQVLLAALNKTLAWILYSGEVDAAVKQKGYYTKADSLSEMFWIDVAADIVTVGLFAYGTNLLFTAVA